MNEVPPAAGAGGGRQKKVDPGIDHVKHVQKKLVDRGLKRMERHPTRDGLPIALPPHKSGHGGKFTWEGPLPEVTAELDPLPPAIDPNDPNYDDEEDQEMEAAGSNLETQKGEGVAMIDDPHVKHD